MSRRSVSIHGPEPRDASVHRPRRRHAEATAPTTPHRHGRYGNPPDVQRMIRRQLDRGRPAWQKPLDVVRALRLRRGAVVADIGAGPGFFTLPLAKAVGPRGHVYAVDPEAAVLDVLRERLLRAGVTNVSPVLNTESLPLLPAGSCDVALIVNVYHHFPKGSEFLRRVARCLKPGGLLANIDWADRETPKGPPLDRRIPAAVVVQQARRAGLRLVAEHGFLPYQYFLVFRRPRS